MPLSAMHIAQPSFNRPAALTKPPALFPETIFLPAQALRGKALIAALSLMLLPGCAPKDYFRSAISEQPCIEEASAACAGANLLLDRQEDYTLGFVEIDDQGQFYDKRQAEALLNAVKDRQQAQYVSIYVHGWHHNAEQGDSSVRRFREILRQAKRRHPGMQVTGVYIGWRGETLALPWLRMLSFWDRKQVSEEVGRNALLDFLLQVETVVKTEGNPDNRLLSIGHSLGASVIFNALHPLLLARLAQPADRQPRAGFGDLVVLLNPAVEAIRYTALRDAAQRHGRRFRFDQRQKPLLLIATAETDGITKREFSWSQKLSALFESHRTLAGSADDSEDDLSEWELDTTAIGHFQPYITHRLQARAAPADNNETACTAAPQWLNAAVQRRQAAQAGMGQAADGSGWDSGGELDLPALLNDPAGLHLSHLQHSAAYDPYWVVQTDNHIFPNHGFIAQAAFWCFVDLSIG